MANDWPPLTWIDIYLKYLEWGAWYSGDPIKLSNCYTNLVYTPTPNGRFWAKQVNEERRTMLHIPIAGDIAGVNADLLFSEIPEIMIPEAHEEKAPSDAIATQDRINFLLREGDIYSRFLKAAETASPMSGVFLKVNWDPEFKNYPILSVVQPDNAIPTFRWGFLEKVTFHKVIDIDGSTVFRHFETHSPGMIYNELYQGTEDKLGRKIDLKYHPETEDMDEIIKTNIKDLTAVYIANKKPNRLWRKNYPGSYLGQSDLSGIEGLMDALDETYTSWMRDLRIARGRIMIPDYMLEKTDNGFRFDIDKEVYVALDMGPVGTEGQEGITINQFDIRAEKHKATASELLERIITSAGYSPQSFGLKGENGVTTATEVKAREGKSYKSQAKKAKYFQTGIGYILSVLLQIDKAIFKTKNINPEYKPNAKIQDSIQENPLDKADSIEKLDRAAAMSIDTKVRAIHPHWNEQHIEAEVQQIMKEQGIEVRNPEMRV